MLVPLVMRGFNNYVVLFRIGTLLAGLIMIVLLGAFVVSCSEVERHDVLTFFFEGVPPLGQEQFSEQLVDNASQTALQTGQQQLWYVHEPRKDCTNCHDRARQSRFKPRTFLKNMVPELCYECHDDFTASAKYVHGPVAVGQCLFCHHHHQSRIEHLLKKPEPQLCYQCHKIDTISSIPAHLAEQQFICTDCHDAHTSSIRHLLKEASLLTDSKADETEAVQSRNFVDSKRTAEELPGFREITATAELNNNSMFHVFWTVSKLIEKGQIKEARTYLEKFKRSKAFTNEEWIKIVQVLNLMDFAANRMEGYSEKVKQQKPADRIGPERPITKHQKSSSQIGKSATEIAELYYLSLAFYYAGQMEKAREGLIEVLKSDLIPPTVAKTIQDDLIGIDSQLTISDRKREIAELYYRSMAFYHAGQFEKARSGLVKVLESGLAPEPMIITIKDSLTDIDNTLRRRAAPPTPEQ